MSIHDILIGWVLGVGSGIFATIVTHYTYHRVKEWQTSGGNGRHHKS
jgi:hypothetical protein